MWLRTTLAPNALRALALAGLVLLCAERSEAQVPPPSQCVTTAVAGGTGDAITTARLPCVPTTTLLLLTISNSNSTAAPTLQPAGSPALPIVAMNGAALSPGALMPGMHATLSSNGSQWFWLNSPGLAGTTLVPGIPNVIPGNFLESTYPFAIYNAFPYAYNLTQAGECIQVGKPVGTACPWYGNFEGDPSTPSWYTLRERIGLVVAAFGVTPWFKNVPGTFSGANFNPSPQLSADQMSKLHRGDPLDSNDTPPCTGVVLSFTATQVITYGWYRQGLYPTSACTPAGTAASVNYTKIYGMNSYVRREATDQQKNSIGMEMDVINNSGVDDACAGYDIGACGGSPSDQPADGGMDIVSFGSNRAAFGLQIRGSSPAPSGGGVVPAFYSAITVTSSAYTGLWMWAPGMPATPSASSIPVGVLVQNSDRAFTAQHRELDSTFSGTPGVAFQNWSGEGANGNIRTRIFYNGNIDLGLQANGGSGAAHTQRIFSSGNNTPDVQWSYQLGTGNNDGVAALSAKQLVLGNSLVVGYTGGTFPPAATTGGYVTMLKGTGVTAPGAGYGSLFFTPGTNAGTCKLVALAGTSGTAVTVLDNIGAGC